MQVKRFRVVDGPLSIRAEPRLTSTKLGEVPIGVELDVDANSRTEADGFIWWMHSTGWSAERRLDGQFTFLAGIEITDAAPTLSSQTAAAAIFVFKVIDGPVSVRTDPSIRARKKGEIPLGARLEVDSNSRVEADGFVWWKHSVGWSAERKIDNSYIILERLPDVVTPPAPPPTSGGGTTPPPPVVTPPPNPTDTVEIPSPIGEPVEIYFRIINGPLSIRAEPTVSAKKLGELQNGAEISCWQKDKVESDGYVWRKHQLGWSAQRTSDRRMVYMQRITALSPAPPPPPQIEGTSLKLPDGSTVIVPRLFTRSPLDIDRVKWIQYFGNSRFAQRIWSEGKTWYRYCQGLHGGFDYGNNDMGTPIFAGMDGVVQRVNRMSSTYSPNYLTVTNSQFTIIYGHLGGMNDFRVGEIVTPDTIVGYIDAGGQNHLHLELRVKSIWIINPLLAMTDAVRDPILQKYSKYSDHFFRDGAWGMWQDPFDQPVLRLSGPPMGPQAR